MGLQALGAAHVGSLALSRKQELQFPEFPFRLPLQSKIDFEMAQHNCNQAFCCVCWLRPSTSTLNFSSLQTVEAKAVLLHKAPTHTHAHTSSTSNSNSSWSPFDCLAVAETTASGLLQKQFDSEVELLVQAENVVELRAAVPGEPLVPLTANNPTQQCSKQRWTRPNRPAIGSTSVRIPCN